MSRYQEAIRQVMVDTQLALREAADFADLARSYGDTEFEVRKARAAVLMEKLHRYRRVDSDSSATGGTEAR